MDLFRHSSNQAAREGSNSAAARRNARTDTSFYSRWADHCDQGVVRTHTVTRTPYGIYDVLGGPQILPGATPMVQTAQHGDRIFQQMQQTLQQGLQGINQVPLVFLLPVRAVPDVLQRRIAGD